MHIAIVSDAWYPQVNGVVTTLDRVRHGLERRGHETILIHPALFAGMPCPRYPEVRLAAVLPRMVERILRRYALDVVHIATEGPVGVSARAACLRRGMPFTTSYHTQFALYLERYAGVPADWTYRALRWFHGRAEHTLVPTESIRVELDDRGFGHLRTWTRGVNTELFRPRDKALLDHLPRPIFLYAGRVAHEKNLHAFLGARLPGTKLIVGDGPAAPGLKARYGDVHWAGYRHGDDLAAHYAASDVFVFPSRTDTFGIVLIEAMASGLPVAALPVAGPRDVVVDGVTGVLDEDIQSAALQALELDPEACRAHAMQFTWDRCVDIFEDTLVPGRFGA